MSAKLPTRVLVGITGGLGILLLVSLLLWPSDQELEVEKAPAPQ